MRYGLNFGAPHVTDCPVKFPIRKRIPEWNLPRGHAAMLVGITNDEAEFKQMMMVANNGRRRLHSTDPKKGWTAIYAY